MLNLGLKIGEASQTVQVTEANTVFQRHKSGDYQGSVWGWLGLLDADEYTYDIIHSKGWRNFYGYSNPKVDALLENARAISDVAQRRAIYADMWTIESQDLAILYLWQSKNIVGMSAKVSGFRPIADGMIRLQGVGLAK